MVLFPTGTRKVCHVQSVQSPFGAYLSPYSINIGSCFLEREADHSPKSSAELKNEWSYTSNFPYALMACTMITLFIIYLYLITSNYSTIFKNTLYVSAAVGPTQRPLQYVLGLLPRMYRCWGLKLTAHVCLVLWLGICGHAPPAPSHTCIWRAA